MSSSIPLDLAHGRDAFLRCCRAQVAKRCLKIGMTGVFHYRAWFEPVAEPGGDAGAAELMQFELIAPTPSLDPGYAVWAPATLNACTPCHSLDHRQQLGVGFAVGRWYYQVHSRVLLFPDTQFFE